MRATVLASAVVLLLSAPSSGRAADLSAMIAAWAQRAVVELDPPARTDIPELLFAGVRDRELGERLVDASGPDQRAMTDSLLSFLSLTEPDAHRRLADLYVVDDFGPPPDQRPPAWPQLRELGVRILERIALDPTNARDVRAEGELQSMRPAGRPARPSEIGGQVQVFQRWWVDRGDDPALTHDSSRIASADDWLGRIETDPPDTAWKGLRMLADLDGAGLKTRLLLDALDGDRHCFLVAECIAAQRVDGVAFADSGVELEHWDAERGRMVGHRIENLRAVARQILDRVTDHIASGADEGALRNDWVYWWKTARFQARYWRNPHSSPTLDPYFEGIDEPVTRGGVEIAPWMRQLYVSVGYRDFLLEQFGPEQEQLTAELIAMLAMNREQAIAAGFNMAYRRRPLLARRNFEGEWVAIPWNEVQALIRRLLERITGEVPPAYARASSYAEDQFWSDWWSGARYDPRWYRDPSRVPERDGVFEMQRGRAQ